MKKQHWTILALLILIAGMTLAMAESRTMAFKVTVPFQVGDATFTPGDYRLSYESGKGSQHLILYDVEKNQQTFVRFVTRLGSRDQGSIVFDTVEQTRHLSEVYIGGMEGFRLAEVSKSPMHTNPSARMTPQ